MIVYIYMACMHSTRVWRTSRSFPGGECVATGCPAQNSSANFKPQPRIQQRKMQANLKKAEDFLDSISGPVQPYLPIIARTLLVATFLEDTLRMM